jgi:hypothetical protein
MSVILYPSVGVSDVRFREGKPPESTVLHVVAVVYDGDMYQQLFDGKIDHQPFRPWVIRLHPCSSGADEAFNSIRLPSTAKGESPALGPANCSTEN